MASESQRASIARQLERARASSDRVKRRKSAGVPVAQDSSSGLIEYSAEQLRSRAYGCPSPVLLNDPTAPPGHRIRAIPCSSWSCPSCGPKRCAEFSHRTFLAISAIMEEQRTRDELLAEAPYEWTLTFRPKDLPGEPRSKEQMAAARKAWNRLRRAISEGRRRQGLPPLIYLGVREYTKRGVPHFHFLTIGNPWPVSVPHRDRATSEVADQVRIRFHAHLRARARRSCPRLLLHGLHHQGRVDAAPEALPAL